eukprot:TRINITY_DN24958_c0_g1_i1.p1 TRINITY_DN24958_c0_g1~~TRINITY_DN24958_c0_g1_i1.p1  ORF type:complete len:343 (+),score=48.90 TRINITY_DN24958_c0_g1_i1:47-1030(+)
MPPPLPMPGDCATCGALVGTNRQNGSGLCGRCSKMTTTLVRTLVGRELGLEVREVSGKIIVVDVSKERQEIDGIEPGWEIRRYDGRSVRTLSDLKAARSASLAADRTVVDVKFKVPSPTKLRPEVASFPSSHPLHSFHNSYLNHEISKETYVNAVYAFADDPALEINASQLVGRIDNIARGRRVREGTQREIEAVKRVFLRNKPHLERQITLAKSEGVKRMEIVEEEQEAADRIADSSPAFLFRDQLRIRKVAEVRSRRFPSDRNPRLPPNIPAAAIQVCRHCTGLSYLCDFCAMGQYGLSGSQKLGFPNSHSHSATPLSVETSSLV